MKITLAIIAIIGLCILSACETISISDADKAKLEADAAAAYAAAQPELQQLAEDAISNAK